MIDFHNHVLPNVDDGPKTIEESIEMLKLASNQGITDVVNTVHFQHPKMENKNVDYNYLLEKVENLKLKLKQENININLHLSAEVFYLPNLVEISSNPLVTIGNGRYMLIEFSSNIYPTEFENQFFKLQSKNIIPIVAHPERYRFVRKDINILEKWLERGYLIQIDAGSILGFFGKEIQNITHEMIKNKYISLIGSDAHNNRKRNFCLSEANIVLADLTSEEFKDEIMSNSLKVLNGEEIFRLNKVNNVKKNIFSSLIKKIGKL